MIHVSEIKFPLIIKVKQDKHPEFWKNRARIHETS